MPATTSTRPASPVPSDEVRPSSRADTDILHSDPENDTEKPVREKLREATITGEARSRLQKKRSFEDDDEEEGDHQQEAVRHVRKKSREAEDKTEEVGRNGDTAERGMTPEPTDDLMDEDTSASLTSPKNKRARNELHQENTVQEKISPASAVTDSETPSDARKSKRPRASPPITTEAATEEPTLKMSTSSGFANTSSTSPFAVAGSKSPPPTSSFSQLTAKPQTSESAFKKSGFGAFASASASPFGSAATGAPSAFASASGSASPWAAKSPTPATQPSVFAAAATTSDAPKSGFGNTSSTSGFGSLNKTTGGGFGGPSGFGGFGSINSVPKASVFASGSGPNIEGISKKPAKAFGASDDTEEETEGSAGEGAEDNAKSPAYETEVKKDKRFYEQNIETGEEGETNVFSERAKIYEFNTAEKKWVERGVGNFKFNISYPSSSTEEDAEEGKAKLMDAPADDDDAETGQATANGASTAQKTTARFIMRATGSQRVILNTKVSPTMPFGDAQGKEPTGMSIFFRGSIVDGESKELKFTNVQLKMKAENASALWHLVQEAQKEL